MEIKSHLYQAVKQGYNHLYRPFLPKKIIMVSGVARRDARLLDRTEIDNTYERELINSIKKNVRSADDVVIVGGGYGVSTVTAARVARSVTTIEASIAQIDEIEETAVLNDVSEKVSIQHSVIGPARNVFSEMGDPEKMAVEELPEASLLVLDCEGAEEQILKGLTFDPRTIIVETHGFLDVPESLVRRLLQERGYEVVDRAVDDPVRETSILTAERTKE